MLIKTICEVCNTEFEFKKQKPSKPPKRACSKECSYKLRIKVRSTVHDPIDKTCVDCEKTFQDTTKKKQSVRCNDCINSNMVKTRHLRGNYARTPEQNAKTTASLLKKYELGWEPNTPESRLETSLRNKRLWSDPDWIEKVRKTCRSKRGVDHWTQTPEARLFISNMKKGKKLSEKAKQRMSESASNRVRNKRESLYTSAIGGTREDLKGYFRSNWEANFARVLNYQNKSWEYEPSSFTLSNGRTYTPDFLSENVYYEIKGRFTDACREKLELFRSEYPDIQLVLIDGVKYDELRLQYKSLIPTWEGK